MGEHTDMHCHYSVRLPHSLKMNTSDSQRASQTATRTSTACCSAHRISMRLTSSSPPATSHLNAPTYSEKPMPSSTKKCTAQISTKPSGSSRSSCFHLEQRRMVPPPLK